MTAKFVQSYTNVTRCLLDFFLIYRNGAQNEIFVFYWWKVLLVKSEYYFACLPICKVTKMNTSSMGTRLFLYSCTYISFGIKFLVK